MNKRCLVYLIFIFLIKILFFSLTTMAEDFVKIQFLDVGEGDAIIVTAPSGLTGLIDSGNLITGLRVYDSLAKLRATSLEFILLTHPHPDHIGGVFTLVQRFSFKSIYDNGEDLSSKADSEPTFRWYQDLIRKNPKYHKLARGKDLILEDVNFRILAPPSENLDNDWNTNSLVMMLEYGKFKCLLMGDGNINTEKNLLALGEDLHADILKAGHHGAKDTASNDFLNRVNPKFAVISVNENNFHRYPDAETELRYKNKGIKLLKTSLSGNITIKGSRDGSFQIETERKSE
jgi:competence protein ComEC